MNFIVGIRTQGYEVQSIKWTQTGGPADNVRCCLDGDATDLGSVMTAKLCPDAWLIAADGAYPSSVKPQFIKSGAETEAAAAWLEANPPPEGIQRTPPNSKPAAAEKKKAAGANKRGVPKRKPGCC